MTLLQFHRKRHDPWNPVQIKRLFCCGIREARGISISQAEDTLLWLGLRLTGWTRNRPKLFKALSHKHLKFSQLIFTQAGRKTYGDDLAALIQEKGLGTVSAAPAHLNPNSQNMVKAYIWAIDAPALIQWWNAQVTDVNNHIKPAKAK